MYWLPFSMPPMAVPSARPTRTRLQDLNARMTSFLAEKQACGDASPEVLDNIKAQRSKVRLEMAAETPAS